MKIKVDNTTLNFFNSDQILKTFIKSELGENFILVSSDKSYDLLKDRVNLMIDTQGYDEEYNLNQNGKVLNEILEKLLESELD